jgi:hypothetical protein
VESVVTFPWNHWPSCCGIGGHHAVESLAIFPWNTHNLLVGYKRVVNTIYSPRMYYSRINTFLKNYQPTAKGRYSLREIKAAIASTWRIGIFSKSCIWYWPLMIKTALTRIKALPTALELAIYGYHFQKVAKRCQKVVELPESDQDKWSGPSMGTC